MSTDNGLFWVLLGVGLGIIYKVIDELTLWQQRHSQRRLDEEHTQRQEEQDERDN